MLVKKGYAYALLYSAGWGQGKGGIPEQMTQGDKSAALGGVLAAGTVNPNAGTLGWRCQAQPGRVPALRGAGGSTSQRCLDLGAGSWNAVAHVRLFCLMSETERVGGSTQEDPAGSRRG